MYGKILSLERYKKLYAIKRQEELNHGLIPTHIFPCDNSDYKHKTLHLNMRTLVLTK